MGQGEDLEEKKEEPEFTMRKSPETGVEVVSEGAHGVGSGDVGSSPHTPPCAPGPRLGEDMKAYVLRPAMRGHMVQCCISRDKSGVDKGMFPFYYLYLEAADGRKVWSGSLETSPTSQGLSEVKTDLGESRPCSSLS